MKEYITIKNDFVSYDILILENDLGGLIDYAKKVVK